jgi:hypothetical protein
MKYITFIIITFLIISCGNSKKSVSNDGPLSVKHNDSENSKLTLLKLVKNNPYNEKGYVMLLDQQDDYGYTNWLEWGPTYVFSSDFVNELKKYRTVEDFWVSDLGKKTIDIMIDCINKNKDNCNVNFNDKQKKLINNNVSENNSEPNEIIYEVIEEIPEEIPSQ